MPIFGPDVDLRDPAYIDDSARLYGRVVVEAGASIWPFAVIRSECHSVRIGARTNVQDHVMIHEGLDHPTVIGSDCSITHHATLHGCTIGDRVLIGINATIMDGASIGDDSIVAGHAIVTEGTAFPPGAVIAGVPAKQVATRALAKANLANARHYQALAARYAAGIYRLTRPNDDEKDSVP
ncbi:MAG: gamma carbonic anhydrase family protein [Pseudomonadota bacterium]